MKKCTALLLSLLIAFSLLPTFAYADTGNESGMQELVEVVWEGVFSGSVCDATVTLYKYQSAEPIDAEYQRMWGTFRLVITDANGNVLLDEPFDTASKSVSLAEPGDYYACVYTAKGDLQGLTGMHDGEIAYAPLKQHFCVMEIHEPSIYEELAIFFEVCCEVYPEDHDRAFREYLAMIHSTAAENADFSLAEGAAYMSETMPAYPEQKYAALYEEFRANEGYATMEITSIAGYEPEILTEEEVYGFWSGECWRYFADGLDIVSGEDGLMIPYAEYISSISGNPPSDDGDSNDGSPLRPDENGDLNDQSPLLPWIAAGAGVAVLGAVVAVLLIRRKKSK